MKTAGVVIDEWKLPIFKEHLDAAGYTYSQHPGVMKNTLTLRVQYEWVAKLKPIIEAAQAACAAGKIDELRTKPEIADQAINPQISASV
jgi:hypothetical protein